VALNIGCYSIQLRRMLIALLGLSAWTIYADTNSVAAVPAESTEACAIPRDAPLTDSLRLKIAHCLGWQSDLKHPLCRGSYRVVGEEPNASDKTDATRIMADKVSLYAAGRSDLTGHVEVHSASRQVNATTASLYRDPKTQQVTRVDLLGDVRYTEPGRLMWAQQVSLNPMDHSGEIHDAVYRVESQHAGALLPAWGLAQFIQRFVNQNLLLRKATYSTCPPRARDWDIEAREITLDHTDARGVARDAVLRIHDTPVFYTPYLSFPTSKARQTGFLMPIYGYSNIGGADLAAPFYWNLAPNYDATLVPHAYTRRGMMMGGEGRWLTSSASGMLNANILPGDKAYHQFLASHQTQYTQLRGQSDNRWSVMLREDAQLTDEWHAHLNYQKVSDDYYLQDFSSNLAILTENQLKQEGSLSYTTDHWLFRGMAEAYQTLNPINQATVMNIYERLPQLLARGEYDDLPLNGQLVLLGQWDDFHWPVNDPTQPQGPRYHANPALSFAKREPWGYVEPKVELVENYYQLSAPSVGAQTAFNHTIPRYSVDSGLLFDRRGTFRGEGYTQTLEPRLYYLNVPYQNQSTAPAFDSAYMIFSTEQLFRANRFSGIDRIGDANQLAYALTSRWLKDASGREKANVSVGQLRYFSNRQVQLCYQQNGACVDNPWMLGSMSSTATTSPIASRGMYRINSAWSMDGDLIWDTATRATNNGDFNFHYQPALNHIVRAGYSYLVNGNLFQGEGRTVGHGALHQATVGYAWPWTPAWSGLGAYSYNISERYGMMTFLGAQYDSCCWAFRLLGGRVFNSLSPSTLKPQYNNNVYVQILLKGLGSVGSSDPASTIQSYLPGYVNLIQR
jgi:LPS-assembly protein